MRAYSLAICIGNGARSSSQEYGTGTIYIGGVKQGNRGSRSLAGHRPSPSFQPCVCAVRRRRRRRMDSTFICIRAAACQEEPG